MVQRKSDWDSYVTRVDGQPASILVDLGAMPIAPSSVLRYLGYIRLHMNAPRADGLAGEAELDDLREIEDALAEELVESGTVYVGRCTASGRRDFFFYLARPDGWGRRVGECMRAFPRHRFECAARLDRDWSSYRDFLFPSAAVWRSLSNRRVCRHLEKNGDTLRATREIDHFATFHDAAARDAFVSDAKALGFAVRALAEPDEKSTRHGVQLWRKDVPSFPEIDDVTRPLLELAAQHGGEYDGWETQVLSA